jgi:hypothetical protein
MPPINKSWVAQQLTDNGTKVSDGNAVVALLNTWESLKVTKPEQQKIIIEMFSKLSLGIPLVTATNENEEWVLARPGALKVGDEVLVLPNAFTGELAAIHNGRRGRVVAVRYGDIIVNTTDGREPELIGTHYNPMHLQKLIKK